MIYSMILVMEQFLVTIIGAFLASFLGVLTALFIHKIEKRKMALVSSVVFREEISAAVYKIALILGHKSDYQNFARLKFLKNRLEVYRNTISFLGNLEYSQAADVSLFYHLLEEEMYNINVEDPFLVSLQEERVIKNLELAKSIGGRVNVALERFETKESSPLFDRIQYKLGLLKF